MAIPSWATVGLWIISKARYPSKAGVAFCQNKKRALSERGFFFPGGGWEGLTGYPRGLEGGLYIYEYLGAHFGFYLF